MNGMVEDARKEDLERILELQKTAFRKEAIRHNDMNIPPMTQRYEEVLDEWGEKIILKFTADGKIVGSVRGFRENDIAYIGKLIVEPSYESRGIGRILMAEIEKRLQECAQYAIFTGEKSLRTIRIYEKLGYSETARQDMGTHQIVHMRKVNKRVKDKEV